MLSNSIQRWGMYLILVLPNSAGTPSIGFCPVYRAWAEQMLLLGSCQLSLPKPVAAGVQLSRQLGIGVCLFALLLSGTSFGQTFFEVTQESSGAYLGLHTSYHFESDSALTIDQAIRLPEVAWTSSREKTPNFGFQSLPTWFRVKLQRHPAEPAEHLLQTTYSSLDYIEFYLVQNRQVIKSYTSGDQFPNSWKPIPHRSFLFPVHIPMGESELYFRIKTEGTLQLPLQIHLPANFVVSDQHRLVGQGLYFGVAAVMFFYNFILFFLLRDISYFYYILTIGAHALFQGCLLGYSFQYLWPDYPILNNYAIPVCLSIFAIFMPLFINSFLHLKEISERWRKLMLAISWFGVVLLIGSFTLPYKIITPISGLSSSILSMIALATGITMLLRGVKHARYFVVAWAAFLVALIILSMNKFGLLPVNPFTEYAGMFGSAAEAVLLSFALADRFNRERAEKFEAQQLAFDTERQAVMQREELLKLKIQVKEEEFQAKRKVIEYEAESKAKSDFLATMSHEIRTPINGVLGMSTLLRESDLDSKQQHYLDVIESSGKTLLSVINDVLDFSKIEAGKMPLEKVDFDLDQLCLECVSMFSSIAEKKGIDFICTTHPGTPVFVNSDPTRLRQIILNLLSNAFKFTQRGYIKLEIFPESCDEQGALLRIEVQDTGLGLDADQVERLFSAFTQAEVSTTRRFGGTGLGLSICKNLVELMGGTIGVDSEKGHGSSFWFTLPVELAAPDFVSEHFISIDELKDKRVLVVDDSPYLCDMVMSQCKSWQMHVETSYDAKDALRRLRQNFERGMPFDLVSMDVVMPGMNGLECARLIRKTYTPEQLAIVILTSVRAELDEQLLNELGIKFATQKPVTPSLLRTQMLKALDASFDDSRRKRARRQLNEEAVAKLQQCRVLVAEDNPVNQLVIKGMLGKVGITPLIVENGAEAVKEVTGDTDYDLVFMDCEMPVMDGYEATRSIRYYQSKNSQRRTPIVALSAHVLEAYVQKGIESGMDENLPKPIEIEELMRVIQRFLLTP